MKNLFHLSMAVLVLASCGRESPTTEPSVVPMQRSGCPNKLPFRAGYVPAGVDRELKAGPGGGAEDNPAVVEFHHEGGEGVFIDVRRGAAFFPVEEPMPIRVVGETAEFGEIEDGIGFNFLTEGGACGRYEVSAYGLEPDEVRRFAEGLRPR